MHRFVVPAVAGLLVASLVLAGHSRAGYMGGGPSGPKPKTLLTFKAMYGVDGPFLGAANPVRGVTGDLLPWVIAKKASGKLDSNGHLTIQVKGLVFPDDPSVPEELRGINDEAEFRGLVSCLTIDGSDVVEENVVSDGFPANEKGNAKISARLTLPDPCIAPVVMVLAGSEDVWFAVSGAP